MNVTDDESRVDFPGKYLSNGILLRSGFDPCALLLLICEQTINHCNSVWISNVTHGVLRLTKILGFP